MGIWSKDRQEEEGICTYAVASGRRNHCTPSTVVFSGAISKTGTAFRTNQGLGGNIETHMMCKTNAKYLVCDQRDWRDWRDLRQETETNLETKTEADPGNVCSIFYHTLGTQQSWLA